MINQNDKSNLWEDNIRNAVEFDYDAVEKSFNASPEIMEAEQGTAYAIIQMLFLVQSLSKEEIESLISRFIELKSWTQIAMDLGLTRWKIRKIYNTALKKVKDSPLMVKLEIELKNSH